MIDKIKEFFSGLWERGLVGATKYCVILLIIAIIAVIYFCGIKGNNDQNFWKNATYDTIGLVTGIDYE